MSKQEMTKHDHVLAGLMFSLQAAAMQQLGKVQDQATGELGVNLEQARSTIDVLEMLKAKCRTDTPDELLKALDAAVMDLQLNYMDEVKKSHSSDRDQAPEGAEASSPADESDNEAGSEA